MSKFIPQNFNDLLCLVFLIAVVSLWIIQGLDIITLRDDVNGSLVVLITLVIQYYFRRAPQGKVDENS